MTMIKDWPDNVPTSRPRRKKKGSSGKPRGALLWAAVGITGLPICVLLGIVVWLLHGYGVI